jgi:FtsH-binding integral membrane protein
MRLSRPAAIFGILGISLFIAGFFLPAVRFPPATQPEAQWGPGLMSHEYPGYVCAEITLMGAASFFRHPSVKAISVALIGWINPLVLLYLVSRAARRLNRARVFIAGAIVVCCLAMWIQLAADHVALLIGHYVWIGGIALLLAAPFADRFQPRDAF